MWSYPLVFLLVGMQWFLLIVYAWGVTTVE
jgi:hypothetical protein